MSLDFMLNVNEAKAVGRHMALRPIVILSASSGCICSTRVTRFEIVWHWLLLDRAH